MHTFIFSIDVSENPIGDPEFFKRAICLDVLYKLTNKNFRNKIEADDYINFFEKFKKFFYPKIKYYYNDPYIILILRVESDFDFNCILTNE